MTSIASTDLFRTALKRLQTFVVSSDADFDSACDWFTKQCRFDAFKSDKEMLFEDDIIAFKQFNEAYNAITQS